MELERATGIRPVEPPVRFTNSAAMFQLRIGLSGNVQENYHLDEGLSDEATTCRIKSSTSGKSGRRSKT